MKRLSIILILIAIVAVMPTPAEPVVLTEDAVIERIRSHNLGLQAQRALLDARERTARTASNVLIPSVRISTGLIRTNEETVPMPPGEPYSMSSSSTLEVQLQLSVAILEGTRTAGLARDAAVASYHETRTQTEETVRIAFHALLLLREGVDVARWGLESAAVHLEQVADAYSAGLASERILRTAESATVEARTTVRRLETEYQGASGALAAALSYPAGTSIEASGALLQADTHPVPPVDYESTSLHNRTDIQKIDAQRRLQQSLVRARTLQQRTPSLSVTQSWNATQLDPFKADNPLPRSSMDRGTLSVMLAMPLDSLLPGSAGSVAISNERDALRSLELQQQQTRLSALEEIASLTRTLEQSTAHIDALTGKVNLAEQIYDLTGEAYNEGLASYLEVRDAERELQGARFDLLNERYTYTTTRIRLEYATGANR